MVTAYDYPSARVADGAGVDMILVGDTLAMVVLGYEDTLQVTTDDMAHHVAAAARAAVPWGAPGAVAEPDGGAAVGACAGAGRAPDALS